MPYNLLLLPLLGGFLLLHLSYYWRFHAQRIDGYRLLVESAIAGTILGILARVIIILTGPTRIGRWAWSLWPQLFPWQESDTAAWALVLGPLLAFVLNLFISREKAKDMEVRRHGNSLTRLLHEAEQEERPISITLANRKWYVGYVAESPNLDPQELYFRLLPLVSGYREKDSLRTVQAVLYEEVYSDPDCNSADFVITLPLKDVQMANIFDMDLYRQYFAEADGDAPAEREPAAPPLIVPDLTTGPPS